jgi:4-hydroxy-tetrahydrodipicolinate reductase
MTKLRVHVHGADGRMGQTCAAAIGAAPDLELTGTTAGPEDLARALAAGRPQVMVEFTVAAVAPGHFRTALAAGVHVVSGTTGIAPPLAAELGQDAARRQLGLVLAPNFAIGMILLQRFAREAARWFGDVEILELHHAGKIDAPSGTALDTARQIAGAAGERRAAAGGGGPSRGQREAGIPIHSVRLPGLLAHQEVWFGGTGQVLTLRHDTSDRTAFVPGVLLAVRQVASRRGLVASLEELLDRPGA